MILKPLLASVVKDDQHDKLRFPLIGSPKLDGIRCLKVNGEVVSRRFKPIPNKFIRETLRNILPDGIDGEIMLRDPLATFQEITSAVMSFDGEPLFVFCPFDYVKESLDKPYLARLLDLKNWHLEIESSESSKYIRKVPYIIIQDNTQLDQTEAIYLTKGYEGIMLRDPNGIYKCNRSTFKEQILLKVKRFEQSEAVIIGIIEKNTNENPKEKDELGYSKRSSKQEGIVKANTLGAFLVIDQDSGISFKIGSGFDDKFREMVWSDPNSYIGKVVTYTHQLTGVLEAPRFPVFKGFRDPIDL